MPRKINLLFLAIILLPLSSLSQGAEKRKLPAELRKELAALLSEAAADASNMNSPTNRMIYSIQAAELLWEFDEKEARKLSLSAMNEMRQKMAALDAEAAAIEPQEEYAANAAANAAIAMSANTYAANAYASNRSIALAANSNISAYPREKRIVRRFEYSFSRKITRLLLERLRLISMVSRNDPALAYEFFRESSQLFSVEELKEQLAEADRRMEDKLASRAAGKDPALALEIGRKKLSDGKPNGMPGIINALGKKDPEKAKTLIQETIKALRSGRILTDFTYNFAKFAESNLERNGSQALFSRSMMQEITDIFSEKIMEEDDNEGSLVFYNLRRYYLPLINKYSPAKAGAIKRKFKEALKLGNDADMEDGAYGDGYGGIRDGGRSPDQNPADGRKEKLSDEEKKAILDEIRKVPVSAREKSERIAKIANLAANLATGGDKEFAGILMREISGHSGQVENAKDAMLNWQLAEGYSGLDANKSFELIESTIVSLNDILEAFIKVIKFIDIDSEAITENGELIANEGPGGGFFNDIGTKLQANPYVIKNLAIADFARTRGLADKFSRQEVRIEVKLLIARSLMEKKSIYSRNYARDMEALYFEDTEDYEGPPAPEMAAPAGKPLPDKKL